MEPPMGLWASLWSFICFLPFFVGLLLLGTIKGALLLPWVCLIVTIANSGIVLGLWPAHAFWTFYCVARSRQLGPILKFVLFIIISALLFLWPLAAIFGSILGGALYGFLAPLIATFEAVGEGKTAGFLHCIVDGTWTTIKGSCTLVRDFADVCFYSYFSIMDDLRLQEPPNGTPYEIRVIHLFGSFFLGLLGILVDVPVITSIALCKCPFMLFKGWHRLFHDLIGREGPFLETACVPFAGLAILLWPGAVVGAVVASILTSYFLGGYAAVISYQESSIHMGLSYIVSSLSIYDEYSNDVLDMPEGSCFPRLKFRRNESIRSSSLSRPPSFHQEKRPPSRTVSLKEKILELKPLKLLEHMFAECRRHGEHLVAKGLITYKDIDECLSGKDCGKVISIGLPAYCILQALLRSVKAGSEGLLLSDGTEMTLMNRPKDTFFEWFFDPLMVMKEQIKVENLSEDEEAYMAKLVLLEGDKLRLEYLNGSSIVKNNEHRKAKIDALARRLQGVTKSISRYPTAKRRFDTLSKSLAEELGRKIGNGTRSIVRSKSALARLFSQTSFGNRAGGREGSNKEVMIQSGDESSQSLDQALV